MFSDLYLQLELRSGSTKGSGLAVADVMLCQALMWEVLVVLKAVIPPLAAGQQQGGSGCSASSPTSAAPASAAAAAGTGSDSSTAGTDALLLLLLASGSVIRAVRPLSSHGVVSPALSADLVSDFRTDMATCLHLTLVLVHRLSTGGDWWQAARTKRPLLLIVMLVVVLHVSATASAVCHAS
jgi:hypothetical protein